MARPIGRRRGDTRPDQLPRLADLAEAGLSNRTADALSYSISLSDLELVIDLLDNPSEVLHFLGRRAEIESRAFLDGDEVDPLGLYLETGFNLGEKEFEAAITLDVTGMSDPIDRWTRRPRPECATSSSAPTSSRNSWRTSTGYAAPASRPSPRAMSFRAPGADG